VGSNPTLSSEKNKKMKTVYVKGQTHYKKYVRKSLSKSKLREGLDFIEGLGSNEFGLFWINEKMKVRDFKRAVGARTIWKFRVKFYESFEEMIPKKIEEEVYS
jgi:hypothetical protein